MPDTFAANGFVHLKQVNGIFSCTVNSCRTFLAVNNWSPAMCVYTFICWHVVLACGNHHWHQQDSQVLQSTSLHFLLLHQFPPHLFLSLQTLLDLALIHQVPLHPTLLRQAVLYPPVLFWTRFQLTLLHQAPLHPALLCQALLYPPMLIWTLFCRIYI